MSVNVDLDQVRRNLIQLEDGIIMSLFDRAQYKTNAKAYIPGEVKIDGFSGSFFEFLFLEVERGFALGGRYLHPEEYSFFPVTVEPKVHREVVDFEINKNINLNDKILKAYLNSLKSICEEGDDGNYGSGINCDILSLQKISRRVHLGNQVAKAKYQEDPVAYQKMIDSRDIVGLMNKLTNQEVEDKLLLRVAEKGKRYGINPEFISAFYRDQIIPLTKEVEIAYFLNRINV